MFPNQINTTNKYRSANNQLLTRLLFVENRLTALDKQPIYTLLDKDKTVDGIVYPSLYRLYMEEEDLTEYEFALKHLDGWNHWQALQKATWFQEYVARWRTELELRIKARALRALQAEAASGTKTAFIANKWLAEKGWVDKASEASRRGRPSKAEVNRLAQEELTNNRQIDEDMKRLEFH